VEDTPDRWVPPAGEREREERERWSGPRELLGPEEEWAGGLTGPGEFGGLAGKKKEEGFGVWVFSFFSKSFLNKFSNLLNQTLLHLFTIFS
jgi:hypothetical protein